MAITHVHLFSVPVQDQDAALRFYVDILGFETLADTEMGPGQRWVQVAPPGASTSITLVDWFPSMPPGSTKGIVLHSDDEPRRSVLMKNAGSQRARCPVAPISPAGGE